jgi:multiple sugar transport system permease protein
MTPTAVRRFGLSARQRRHLLTNIEGYLFVLPVVLGLLIWTLGPFVASFFLSLTSYDLLGSPQFIGLQNYQNLLFHDPLFWISLKVTIIYSLVAVPAGLVGSLLVALLLNAKVRGLAFFRTSFYMPSIVPAIASAVLWGWLLNPDWGLINVALHALHLPTSRWLASPHTALMSLVLMSLWGVGGPMVIYLAGLQGIPGHLYEAASIDGANRLQRFWHVTVPMLSPTIFFNLIMGIIGSLQYFTQAFVLTAGGPDNSTEFYVLNLYQKAFQWLKMGYASAMAWILFLLILLLTLLVFRSSAIWVFYEGGERRV